MRVLLSLLLTDMKRRSKDGFMIGYNIVFPLIMILLLGYLTSQNYGREFTGYQYYAVVMPSFCIAMSMLTAAYAGKDDAYKGTAIRFLYAPIPKFMIVLAKLLSCMILLSLCNLIVILFSSVLLKLPVKGHFLRLFSLLTAETFAVCAIGLFIGFGMKNFIFIKNILNIPICVCAILAGAFYPIGTLNRLLELILRLSPLTWINRSIFLYLYDERSGLLTKSILAFSLTGIVFALAAAISFKKEEFIHGDLPGYEK